MPRLAFIFPGQGAQFPGMGKELAENFAEAGRVFQQANDIIGYDLSKLCFEGPAEQLNQTEFAQPALLVASLAAFEVLKGYGQSAVVMAGLSLGEYSALVASGALQLQQALPLVQTRARLMRDAVPVGMGAMAAVMGLDADLVENACSRVEGIVAVANYNCPGQLVISGQKQAVETAAQSLKSMGGRVVPLAISVPCHCQLMNEAALKLKPHLEKAEWQEPEVDVISNVNARENKAAQFPDLLVKQMFSPVLWEQSVRYMMEKADYFIEVGPGSSLSGLVKKIDRNRVIGQVNDLKSLQKTIEKVGTL